MAVPEAQNDDKAVDYKAAQASCVPKGRAAALQRARAAALRDLNAPRREYLFPLPQRLAGRQKAWTLQLFRTLTFHMTQKLQDSKGDLIIKLSQYSLSTKYAYYQAAAPAKRPQGWTSPCAAVQHPRHSCAGGRLALCAAGLQPHGRCLPCCHLRGISATLPGRAPARDAAPAAVQASCVPFSRKAYTFEAE